MHRIEVDLPSKKAYARDKLDFQVLPKALCCGARKKYEGKELSLASKPTTLAGSRCKHLACSVHTSAAPAPRSAWWSCGQWLQYALETSIFPDVPFLIRPLISLFAEAVAWRGRTINFSFAALNWPHASGSPRSVAVV